MTEGARERTAALIARTLDGLDDDEIEVGTLLERLRGRSYGGVFMLLAALGVVPGLSLLAGPMLLWPAWQLVRGDPVPRLPVVVTRRRVGAARLRALGDAALPRLERIERVVRPRWTALTAPPFTQMVGALVMALAVIVMIPLPLSNVPPAIAVVALSLALLERDGVVLLAGVSIGLVALLIGVVVTFAAVRAGAMTVKALLG